MNDNKLREDVKILKAKGLVKNYVQVAELLDMSKNSFYNWLKGYYNLGVSKKNALRKLIYNLSTTE